MYEPNVERLLARLTPEDVVLDIGGWARPFNRANYVIDMEPYETRGYYEEPQAGRQEQFTKNTWIQRDICERTPFPFNDKEIDFAICSHTLEDLRDPLWVCSEMNRIAKRGYIEVPSRVVESCRGVEPYNLVGWSHHRWLVDIEENSVTFLMKYHMIHSHWRFSFPKSYKNRLPDKKLVQWLFWEDGFKFSEKTIHGFDSIDQELESFEQKTHPYSSILLRIDRFLRNLQNKKLRIQNKVKQSMNT